MKNSWTQSQETTPLDEEIASGSSMMSMRFLFTAAVCPTRNRQPNRLRPGSQLTQMSSSESKYLASGTISRSIHRTSPLLRLQSAEAPQGSSVQRAHSKVAATRRDCIAGEKAPAE